MVEFYISWCPGITEDLKALEHIKNSEIIDGVEGIYVDDAFFKLKELNIKYSVHNPTFKDFKNVYEKEFNSDFPKNKLLNLALKESSTNVLSFHLPRVEDELDLFVENINFLQSKTDKSIIVENCGFWRKEDILNEKIDKNISKEMSNYLINEFISETFSIEFLDKFTKENNIGILLDISHIRITITSLSRSNLISESIDEFFIRYAKVLGDRVRQIHINDTFSCDDILLDRHGMLNERSESIRILKLIIPYLKNLEFVNLEINTKLSPIEHVKELEKEIMMIKKEILF